MASPTLSLPQTTGAPALDLWAGSPSAPTAPVQKTGIAGVLENSDSPLNLANLGSVAGSVLGGVGGAVAAPFTLGAINPVTGAIAGGAIGGAAGEAGREALNGEKLSAGNIAGQAGLGAIGSAGGELLGTGIKAIGGAVGKGLLSESDNLALKGAGMTPSQALKFATTTGLKDEAGNATPQAVVKWMGDNGLAGQGLDAITGKLNDIQSQFDSIAKNSNIKVDPTVLQKNMQDALSKFMPYDAATNPGGSANPADHNIAKGLEAYLNNVSQKLGDSPGLDALNAERQVADSSTSEAQFRADPQQFGPARIVGNVLRQTAQETADNAAAGTATGSLKETGAQLNKLYSLQKIAEANAFKGIPGSTPGLVNYLSGLAGGLAGGPVGGAVGMAVPNVLKNPAVLSGLSKATGAAGDAVGTGAANIGGALASPAGQGAVTGAIGGTIDASNPPASPSLPPMPQSSMPSAPDLSGGDPAASAISALQAGQPLSQDQYQALLEKDLTSTGGRFSDKITAAYQAGNPAGVQQLGVASGVANSLQDLYQKAGGAAGPISGGIESALGQTGLTAKSVKAYNDQSTALGQEIINQIYGGTGTAADRDQVLALIPQITDSQYVAQSKMSQLRSLIQTRISAMTGSTPGSVTASNSGPSLSGATP